MICGWEGETESVRRRRSLSQTRLRLGGAVPLGASAGRSWNRNRYGGPYLRDELMDLGVMVETLETAHTWSRLDELYRAVSAALRGALGERSIVMCHVSHAYPDGASLYFTFFARARRGQELEQWRTPRAPPARRSSRPRARSPTTTQWAATTPPTCAQRSARWASTPSVPSRSASTRRGS